LARRVSSTLPLSEWPEVTVPPNPLQECGDPFRSALASLLMILLSRIVCIRCDDHLQLESSATMACQIPSQTRMTTQSSPTCSTAAKHITCVLEQQRLSRAVRRNSENQVSNKSYPLLLSESGLRKPVLLAYTICFARILLRCFGCSFGRQRPAMFENFGL
jgi:hypothetical protein